MLFNLPLLNHKGIDLIWKTNYLNNQNALHDDIPCIELSAHSLGDDTRYKTPQLNKTHMLMLSASFHSLSKEVQNMTPDGVLEWNLSDFF